MDIEENDSTIIKVIHVPSDRDLIGLSSIFLHNKDCTNEREMNCEAVQLERLTFLYNRCPRNTIEVASYLLDKYKDTDISYLDFVTTNPDDIVINKDDDKEATTN